MAQVARPPSERANALLASVFSGSSIPWPRHENKRVKLNVDSATVKQELERGLKPLLGIEVSSHYAYGLDGPTAEGQPFRIPVKDCEPMHLVRRPNQADHLQQRSRLLKSPIWQSMRNWISQPGPDLVIKIVAGILDQLLGQYVRSTYKGCYRPDVVPHLEFWIQNIFTGVVGLCLEISSGTKGTSNQHNEMDLTDLKRWRDIAFTHLGALRVNELLDMIMAWDEDVNGINDLRHFTTSPATRSYLTTHFTDTLSARLLHPGSSTIEILHHYISIIRAFRKLDPKGVLLDRVARRVRKYLKDRDDTIAVIVGGLLSDPFDEDGQLVAYDGETLAELAQELSRRDELDEEDDGELDWDNMNWMPDPVDAAPDYMKSKNTDVIGSLTSLFESKDVFVKELQTTLADRLLKNKPTFELEINVVNHLKTRFGDNALQGCEVMLRDVLDSRKVDEVIRKEQATDNAQQRDADQPELHAKILSRLFWPTMSDQGFKLPSPIIDQQASYEKGFETLKQSRKLTWLNSIGHVEVELHLEDRTVTEEVLPYQAAVIHAFESRASPISVDDLAIQLDMSPTLVRSACIFWLSRRVLTEPSKDSFLVLETLPPEAAANEIDTPMHDSSSALPQTSSLQSNAAALAAADAAAAREASEQADRDRKSRMALYHQFVISMLTNQGAMPLPRIAMMLGFVVPGGFPFSNEELKEFLGGMVKEGVLECGMGGNWRVVG